MSKKYSEIDEFYSTLLAQYPSIHLPAMPRKVLFVGETDIRERRVAFDELVRFISKNPSLSTCPELMEFLGKRLGNVFALCVLHLTYISIITLVLNVTGAKGSLHEVKASNTSDIVRNDNEDDGLDFFGNDEVPTTQPVNKPVEVVKAPEEEEDDEEELFDPLGSVR